MKTILSLFVASVISTAFAGSSSNNFVVHEWGTFTSVQGGNGVQLQWQANQISDLPKFVYNWYQPGLGRSTPMPLLFGKGGLSGLQRMETPVLYFYSETELDADVDIQFPKGLITEWYPQAGQIGPTSLKTNINPVMEKHTAKESRIHWQNVHIIPGQSPAEVSKLLRTDTNGIHYFAARDADSATLRIPNFSVTNAANEHEKFLFYRGTGSFGTPLVVSTEDDGTISVKNTGRDKLSHLFLLHVENGKSEWAHLENLDASREPIRWRKINSITTNDRPSVAEVQTKLGNAMAEALVAEGLFPPEARAMVKTWSDAWFKEEGVRVLYILPRAWTDEILPLKMKPTPDSLVRVMVGRAEIITPELQKEVAATLKQVEKNDAAAKEQMTAYWKRLGRFYNPTMQLANEWNRSQTNKPVAVQAKN